MAREFINVCKEIIKVAPKGLANALEKSAGFWAPEVAWDMLCEYVNSYVQPSSKNPTAVAVYARLCDCSEAEMKARFESDNL